MTIERKIQLILHEVDKEFTIPTYMEKNVKRGIRKALNKIEQEERKG
ncbi:hypothetical protein [Anaerosporobacter sp.]